METSGQAFFSASRNIKDFERIEIFANKLESAEIQMLEKALLREMLDQHNKGNDVLLIEADTYVYKELYISELDNNYLQLFALIGKTDFPDIFSTKYYANSGVIWWPANAPKIVEEVIKSELNSEWPFKWAHYQAIWNKAYYAQFESFEAGRERILTIGDGKYNWFPGPSKVDAIDAVIFHMFNSRGIAKVLKLQKVLGQRDLSKFLMLVKRKNKLKSMKTMIQALKS